LPRRAIVDIDGSYHVLGFVHRVARSPCHAVTYARGLGFEPHPDFEAARGHLGLWHGHGTIGFGREGRPLFVEGAADDVAGILLTCR
jgi:hypothetical protein